MDLRYELREAFEKFDPDQPRDTDGRWTKTPGGRLSSAKVFAAMSISRREKVVQKRQRELTEAEDEFEAMKGYRPSLKQVRDKMKGNEAPARYLKDLDRAWKNLLSARKRLEEDLEEGIKEIDEKLKPINEKLAQKKDGPETSSYRGRNFFIQKMPNGLMITRVADRENDKLFDEEESRSLIVNTKNGSATLLDMGGSGLERRFTSVKKIGGPDDPQDFKAYRIIAERFMTDKQLALGPRDGPKIAPRGIIAEQYAEQMLNAFEKFGFNPISNRVPDFHINDGMKPGPKESAAPDGRYYPTGKFKEGVGNPWTDPKPPRIESRSLGRRSHRKRMILRHEYGHHIDNELGRGFQEATTERNNKTVNELVDYLEGTRAMRLNVNGYPPKTREYLRSHSEIFARAFAQWVAEREGDVASMAEMHDEQWMGQWTEAEFAPAARILDRLFTELEWLRPTNS